MKILVTGANGDLADSIGRVLRGWRTNIQLDGADSRGSVPGLATFDRVHPLANALQSPDAYLASLAALANQQLYDLIIPCSEPEIFALSSAPDVADNLPLVINTPENVTTFSDKLATARWLSQAGLPTPLTWPLADVTPDLLPIFVKPRIGWGSRGLETIRTRERLTERRAEADEDLVGQSLLSSPDQEHTCAVVKLAGEIRVLAMHRTLQGGQTAMIETVSKSELPELLHSFSSALDDDHFLNVQLRITESGPQIFEVNPRFSGTVMMRHRIGFSDLVWALEAREGIAPPQVNIADGLKVFRMSREEVFDRENRPLRR